MIVRGRFSSAGRRVRGLCRGLGAHGRRRVARSASPARLAGRSTEPAAGRIHTPHRLDASQPAITVRQAIIIPTPYRHPSVCLSLRLSVPWRSCPRLGHRRPPEMCGLRTRPRTDVDPPRVELPSARAYRLAAPGAITCLI